MLNNQDKFCPDCESTLRSHKVLTETLFTNGKPWQTAINETFDYACGFLVQAITINNSETIQQVLHKCGPDIDQFTIADIRKLYGDIVADDLGYGILDANTTDYLAKVEESLG